MKKLLCTLLLCAGILSLTACAVETMAVTPSGKQPEILVSETQTEVESGEEKSAVILPYGNLEIAAGESYSLDLPEGEWSISNPDVAVIDQFGELTGLAAGKTWLSAQVDGSLCTIPVTVRSLSVPEKQEKTSGKKAKYRIVVNKTHNYVAIYAWEDEELTTPLRAMICSTGKNTPNGTYPLKSRKVWNRLYGYVWGKYATVITGDFLFHSVPFDEKNSATLLTGEYNKLGTTASAGCIRMTVEGAKWIYDYCKPGSQVIFTKEDVACPVPVDPAIHVNDKSGWDPTDPDEENPWHKKTPFLEANGKFVALGEAFDTSTVFAATDSAGNDVTDRVEIVGEVDTTIPGIYLLEGSVTDDLGKTATSHVYLRVVAPKNQ